MTLRESVENLLCALDDLPITVQVLMTDVAEAVKVVEAELAKKTSDERTTFTMEAE